MENWDNFLESNLLLLKYKLCMFWNLGILFLYICMIDIYVEVYMYICRKIFRN